jgi:hypothetical protein
MSISSFASARSKTSRAVATVRPLSMHCCTSASAIFSLARMIASWSLQLVAIPMGEFTSTTPLTSHLPFIKPSGLLSANGFLLAVYTLS